MVYYAKYGWREWTFIELYQHLINQRLTTAAEEIKCLAKAGGKSMPIFNQIYSLDPQPGPTKSRLCDGYVYTIQVLLVAMKDFGTTVQSNELFI